METISLPFASFVFQTLGLPGLIFIIWWWDHKAQVKQREQDLAEHAKERETAAREITAILSQYREDISEIKRLYDNNVDLVRGYEKSVERIERLYQETLSVVALNTQAQTKLVVAINNNDYCPQVRAAGPNR